MGTLTSSPIIVILSLLLYEQVPIRRKQPHPEAERLKRGNGKGTRRERYMMEMVIFDFF